MHSAARMRQYQQQAISSSSPEQLVLKLYDLGIQSCHRNDRPKLRAVLSELIGSLNFEAGGEIANGLYSLYEYCINESVSGDLDIIEELLTELRATWKQAVLTSQAA